MFVERVKRIEEVAGVIERLLNSPLKVKNFTPMKREEIYGRT
jgi:uncharacterized protein Yka (UPF0111/DUF47 family)